MTLTGRRLCVREGAVVAVRRGEAGAPPVVGQSAVVAGREAGAQGCLSALRIAEGRAVDGDRVAAMAEPAEEGIDHGFVPENAVPLFVLKVGRDECGFLVVPLLHEQP